MIVTNTFLSKCNTIVDGSTVNTGLNPILQLYYGNMHTRGLLYFDESKVKELYQDKTYCEHEKMRHVLKMWNASDINVPGISKKFIDSYLTGNRERATSFELLLLYAPKEWDGGRGFDFVESHKHEEHRAYSEYGSNWYNAKTDTTWDSPGVYNDGFIMDELENEDSTIVVARQSFDFGNETLEMDITDIFNDFILENRENHGFVLMFNPSFEQMKTRFSQYCGFFTNHTNTFFEPYIQTTYDETIEDSRASFVLNKENKLYFYSNIGGNSVNLDYLPYCTIDGKQYQTHQQSKGVYYVNAKIGSDKENAPTTHRDKWTNIKYNNTVFPEVELSFTTLPYENHYQFGLPFDTQRKPRYKLSLSGIDRNEKVPHGEIRKLVAHVKAEYTSDQECPDAEVDYRVYTVFDNKEMDVIKWHQVDKEYNTYLFRIDSNSFVPQKYHIDLRVKYGDETLTQQDALVFEIVSNADKMNF